MGKLNTDAGTGRQIRMNQELSDLPNGTPGGLPSVFGESRLSSSPPSPLPVRDLRHTGITKLAESGGSDSTVMVIEATCGAPCWKRYSHIRMNAKHKALESLSRGPNATVLHGEA